MLSAENFMCCRGALYKERKTPDGWKHLFMECGRCLGPKTLCSIQIGNPPPLRIWICVPCHNAQPSIRDIIEANSVKDPLL